MNMTPLLLSTLELDAAQLVREHPPVWFDGNKQLVASMSCPPGSEHRGRIRATRWRAGELPEQFVPGELSLQARAGVFGYERASSGETHWYLNFADRRLFVAYGTGLLAQDEHQVAEHPALGSVAEAMNARPDQEPLTFDTDPTPVLITGVERRCVLSTAPDVEAGRIGGLYGNRFRRASPAVVRGAVTVLDPPTISNILAIEAPPGDWGPYSAAQILLVLRTAVAGYRAAVAESEGEVVIHTGFWGCGAYGGNRELMALLQILAARMAGVSKLVFYTFDDEGMSHYRAGEAVAAELGAPRGLDQLVEQIVSRGYAWGESDGN